tara:strand:+ start:110 stop:337 length:228 start_codon:yes stop_codon:yes gene_type:complete
MSYVHGLGDAQEALSIQEDRENDWISSIKMPCPHCKSLNTNWDDKEEEWFEHHFIITFEAYCDDCDKNFTFEHEG